MLTQGFVVSFWRLTANHLWQSAFCAAVVWLLTLALRKNRAAVRYWLWLAASVKFLIPFSLLVSAGAQLGWRTAPAVAQPQFSFVMEEIAQPFAAPAPTPLPVVAAPALSPMPAILFGVWLCGVAIGAVFWLRWWRRIRAVQRAATPLPLNLPIRVMSSPGRLEPGVVGIVKPVLLLPEGIADRLTPPQLEAILAHELRHVQRQDNLTAAIHMVVETLFWFHPLVWWIRARLVEERELACDEGVLRLGSEPQVYAESILKVCEFYLAEPVACTAGVSGEELKKRIEGIMANCIFHKLNFAQKLLLAMAAIGVVAGPIATGLFGQTAPPAFEVASIKPAVFPSDAYFAGFLAGGGTCGIGKPVISGNRVRWPIVTLCGIIRFAYDVPEGRIIGAPDWMTKGDQSIFYAIEAKSEGEGAVTQEAAREMSRSLLADRFQLKLHRERRVLPVYSLVVGKGGPKLSQSCEDAPTRFARLTNGVASPPPSGDPSEGPTNAQRIPTGRMGGFSACKSMAQLADLLTHQLDRPVLDKTGLTGEYSVALSWAPEGDPDRPGAAPTIWTAIQEQLGLKLEPSRDSVEVLVIDHAEKPSGN